MKFLFSLFITTLVYSASAQFSISGFVLDSLNSPLPGASVVVSDLNDSTMVSFGMTNEDGLFHVDLEDRGSYYVSFSFIGYAAHVQDIGTDWSTSKVNIGEIHLAELTTALQELTVEADRIPMGMKGDTIVYDANAFKTRDGASVEDLLKKMPGIDVDRDGNIKAMGEDVVKVLVDGKEFFGGDPKTATKNLDAEAVDKVEVFDKKSEVAEFTGVDDGNEEKTINLELKEDFKKGGFGRIALSAGTQDTYYGKLNFNRFSPSTQFSVIANGNNINERAFTIEDYMDFMGGLGNLMAFGDGGDSSGVFTKGGGASQGINTDQSVGLNFNHSLNSKWSINTNYFLLSGRNSLRKQVKTTSFSDSLTYNSNQQVVSNSKNQTHRLNSKLVWKKNPYTELSLSNNLRGISDHLDKLSSTEYFPLEVNVPTVTENDLGKREFRFGWSSNLVYKKKFKKEGRSWISEAGYDALKAEQTNTVDNLLFDSYLIQNQEFTSDVKRKSLNSAYTEPFGKKWYMTFRASYQHEKTVPQRLFFDVIDDKNEQNDILSGSFKRVVATQDLTYTIRKNLKKVKSEAGVKWRRLDLQTTINNRSFDYLLPYSVVKFNMKGTQKLEVAFNTSTKSPSLTELITIPNNSDPNRFYIGNPSLIPEYNHRLSVNYNMYDGFDFVGFFVNVQANKTTNKIVEQTVINDGLTITAKPVNTDFYEGVSFFANHSRPIKPLKLVVNIDASINLSRYNAWLNETPTRVGEETLFANFSISNRKKKKLDASLGINLNFTSRSYEVQRDFNQNFSNYDWYASVDWDVKKDLLVYASYTMRRYTDVFFSDSQQLQIVNAGLRKSFKKDFWSVGLSANDIFNQTIGLSRNGSSNGLTEERFNTLSQFFMLKISRKLGRKKKGKNDETSIQKED